MRVLRKIMALTLALMLVLSMGAMTAVAEDATANTPTGVSSVSVTPEATTVVAGAKQQFTASAMGVSGVEVNQPDITWKVTPAGAGTTITTGGELTVAANETATTLTVTATWTNSGAATEPTATATVTVTKPTPTPHKHTKECLTVDVSYTDYDSGQGFVHMDTAEAAPKSNYFQVYLDCKESGSLAPAKVPVTIEVVGEFKDTLTATKPAPYNVSSSGVDNWVQYASRLILNSGKTIQGAKKVDIKVSVGDLSFERAVDLYAEAKDPVYSSGAAEFSVDLKNPKSSYTSSVVAITVPGGVRTIAAVAVEDKYLASMYTAELVDNGIRFVAKADENKYLNLDSYSIKVKVTFKARTVPLTLDIPIETTVTNGDLFTLDYDKELDFSKEEYDTPLNVVVDKSLTTGVTARVERVEVKPSEDGETIAEGYYNNNDKGYYLEGYQAGSTTFDATLGIHAQAITEDEVQLSITNAKLQKTNNPIKVSGEMERGGLRSQYTRQIDINNPDSYKIDVKLTPDGKNDKVTNVTVVDGLAPGYKQLEGKVTDYFTVGEAKIKEDGSCILPLTLKNDANVTLKEYSVGIRMDVTLESEPKYPMNVQVRLNFVADAPVVTAYTYGTDKPAIESTMAVGESKKFDIKSTRSNGVNKIDIYSGDDALVVVRGSEFLGDRTEKETITLNLREALPAHVDTASVGASVYYTPNITNNAVKLKVDGNWYNYNDIIAISDTENPTDPEDPTDPDPKPDPKPDPDDKPSGGGGSTGSNNTANTPATSDKVNSTVEALKNPEAALPKDVVKTTTASGAAITTIPVAMTTGSATVGSSLFNTLGSAPATVGLKLTVSNGMYGGSMEVIIPGGFGKITEPGRISFPMDYSATAEHSSTMTAAVKGDNAVSMTAKVGGNFTLPVTATVTVPTKIANGTTVNIYKYDPITNKLIAIGKAVVKDGKLTFATKLMGEMLFTTGTI